MRSFCFESSKLRWKGFDGREEPGRRLQAVLTEQTTSRRAKEPVAGHDGRPALSPLRSLPVLPRSFQFLLVHTCVAVRVPGGNWRPHQQDLTLPLPENECPEPRLMKAN